MAAMLTGLAMIVVGAIDPEPPTREPVVPSPEIVAIAAEAGVDPMHLLGAVIATRTPARQYLIDVGELAPPYTPPPAAPSRIERIADCIIQRESRGNPAAVNRSSGASGLGQFLPSTWRGTPQGRAGLSVFDPVANRAAVIWMLEQGRGREFVTIGGC